MAPVSLSLSLSHLASPPPPESIPYAADGTGSRPLAVVTHRSSRLHLRPPSISDLSHFFLLPISPLRLIYRRRNRDQQKELNRPSLALFRLGFGKLFFGFLQLITDLSKVFIIMESR